MAKKEIESGVQETEVKEGKLLERELVIENLWEVTDDDIGASITGTVKGVKHDIPTSNGKCDVLVLENDEGINRNIWICAYLRGFNWFKFEGMKIKITFTSMAKSGKKRPYKVFEVRQA